MRYSWPSGQTGYGEELLTSWISFVHTVNGARPIRSSRDPCNLAMETRQAPSKKPSFEKP